MTDKGALLPGLILSATAMIALAITGTFEELFISIALLGTALDAFTYSAVLRLRQTEPDLPRPFRARGYPWLPMIVVLYVLVIIIATAWADPSSTVRVGLALLASIPASLWLRSRRSQPSGAAARAS